MASEQKRAKWREETRRRREKNPEAMKAIKKASYERHYERNAAKRRLKYAENAEAERQKSLQYRRKNYLSIRNSRLKTLYGITLDQYNRMLAQQGWRCAVCRTDSPGRWGNWNVDHCHTTGTIRGLLCETCNRALGLLKDSASILRAAADYIERGWRKAEEEVFQ